MAIDIESKLAEFVAAQKGVYGDVVRELTAGRKRTHWIWFIFPQMAGLGFSLMARKFGIESKEEAIGYLKHGVLGPRLLECTQLMLAVPGRDIEAIMGYPDNLKFRSSMTLFAAVAPEEGLFAEALEKFLMGSGICGRWNCWSGRARRFFGRARRFFGRPMRFLKCWRAEITERIDESREFNE